ncbi:MAG: ankyrin repeat domain-containing protein [Gammaproteobacteria bacterium]
MINYYEILEVQEDATDLEIRQSYRRLLLQYHPDRNKSPDAVEKIKIIIEANEVLSDKKKREEFDNYLRQQRREESNDFSMPEPSYERHRVSQDELLRQLAELMELMHNEMERKRQCGGQLLLAICQENWVQVEQVLAGNPDLEQGLTPAFILSNNLTADNLSQYYGARPLFLAIYFKNYKVAKFLIDMKANVNVQTENGLTPLHIATWRGELSIVKILRDNGAFPHFTSHKGNTPLHTAINCGRIEVALYLIDHPSETRNPFSRISSNNRKNNTGETPLRLAINKAKEKPEFWRVVDALIKCVEIDLKGAEYLDIQIPVGYDVPKSTQELLKYKLDEIKKSQEQQDGGCMIM